jgi:hypothetical protein
VGSVDRKVLRRNTRTDGGFLLKTGQGHQTSSEGLWGSRAWFHSQRSLAKLAQQGLCHKRLRRWFRSLSEPLSLFKSFLPNVRNFIENKIKDFKWSQMLGLTPVILATSEAEIRSWPAWANSLWEPHLQNNQSKMEWRPGSIGRLPA